MKMIEMMELTIEDSMIVEWLIDLYWIQLNQVKEIH
jgi:hypothetical protein